MKLQELECENCGVAIEWDGIYGKSVSCHYCGATFIPAATLAEDVWLMTDPVARARYEFRGTLDKLEHDIRYEVLRGHDWSDLDRAYLQEIARLEAGGIIRKLATFWAISPQPPVYRALANGAIQLKGHRISFRKGDEIIWACPMTRDQFNLNLPVLVGDFHNARVKKLCGDMENAMRDRMN